MVAGPLMVRHAGICNTVRVRVCLGHRVVCGAQGSSPRLLGLELVPGRFRLRMHQNGLALAPRGVYTLLKGLLKTRTPVSESAVTWASCWPQANGEVLRKL